MACLPAARSVSEVTSTSQTEQLAEHVEELTIQVNTLQNQVQLLSCGITTSDNSNIDQRVGQMEEKTFATTIKDSRKRRTSASSHATSVRL